jgi:Animal haem peroxidase
MSRYGHPSLRTGPQGHATEPDCGGQGRLAPPAPPEHSPVDSAIPEGLGSNPQGAPATEIVMSSSEPNEIGPAPVTRRSFLARIGLGAGALALGGSVGQMGELLAPPAARSATATTSPTTFGRMFPNLPPFADATNKVKSALTDLGKPGGILDAKDNLAAGPVLLITDPSLSANNPNNATHTAGTHFFGQFVDHDITFDTTSKLGVPTEPASAPNSRSPSLDIDALYGGGPVGSPQLYDSSDPAKLKIESGGIFEDLPRTGDGTAIIGDPRNDENLMIAGLHAAFILFHNHAVESVRAQSPGTSVEGAFAEARRLTTWHYHWLVLHEFLPLFVGQAMVDDILANGRRFYRPALGQAFMPVEFQGASYRFGHSMVRPSYRANLKGDNGGPFFGMIFDPAGDDQADPVDLRGGARAPRRFIGWQTFFDFGDGEVKPNKQVDTHISTPLFNLPLAAIASHDQPQVLPQRNLLRQLTWSLPSGQAIAAQMGVSALSEDDLHELKQYQLAKSTPLWYYVLKEAELRAGGLHLGPVGGRIVGEVLIGLLQSDPGSYLVAKPKWKPTLGPKPGSFRMVDFLRFAGVDPASRHTAQPNFA